jgi:probable rRNA maturation factor
MIHLTNRQRRVRIPAARVRRLAARIAGRRSLSIAFVGNAEIRRLNRRFLGHDYATDVLAFPLGTDLFGEVVVSAEYAAAEARRRGIPLEEELLRYVVHGILHLLGYDDHRPADRRRMWVRQERELGRFLGRRRG